ncbi:MAG: hypothetical protein H8F28_10690 [Fibrella sp.]|nr:hypothetical protein [Armatimonadota bacterium]
MTQHPRFFVYGIFILGIVPVMVIPVSAFGQRTGRDQSITTDVQAIRKYYTRINTEAKRYTKKERDLSGFSAEGGTLTGYYGKNELRKMVAIYYGESGRKIEEYYFADGSLIFVLSTDLRYVRPLTFDGKDTGEIASTEQNRIYFNKSNLIQWLTPNGKPVKTDDTTARLKSKEVRATAADLLTRLRHPPVP